MPSSILVALVSLATVYCFKCALDLARNIRRAKKSGIPYVVVPFYSYDRLFMVFGAYLLSRFESYLPKPSITSWRYLCRSQWPWNLRYEPFHQLGTDTFITVAPGGLILHTADPAVISQITTRRNDFPKPTFLYKTVNIYGANIVSSEGEVWRRHRKLTSPAFGERNNRLVWDETLRVTQSLTNSWMVRSERGRVVDSLLSDTMRLSLNVFGRAGFGQELEVPGSEDKETLDKPILQNGHTMTFVDSLEYVLKMVLLVMIAPKWLMQYFPSESLQKSWRAYEEWGQYMREMVALKRSEARLDTNTTTIDLLGQLIKGSEKGEEKEGSDAARLSDSEVMGNLFIFIIAGHETTATSIHFCLVFLAMHPEIQRRAQRELDDILGGRPLSEWDYDSDLPRLLNSFIGAIMHEELRLITPVFTIPKQVCSTAQQLIVNGKEVTAPAGMMVRLCVAATHRNPKYWPHGPPKDPRRPYFPPANLDNDLEEFKPERWLGGNDYQEMGGSTADSMQSNAVPLANDESPLNPPLFEPVKGSYIPFSDGPRSCLGRRFAQVEVLAALAVVLTQASVELAVDEWASDEDVEGMTQEERRRVWAMAEEKVRLTWQSKMKMVITLQLRDAHVPLKFVKRGKEKFWES